MIDAHAGLPPRPLAFAANADPGAMTAPQPVPAPPAADGDTIQGLIERLSGDGR